MKDINEEMRMTKIVFRAISVLVILVGLFFSYLVAELDDAPGFIFIGSTITLVGASFVYGFGEIIISLKQNNILLTEIKEKLNNKK